MHLIVGLGNPGPKYLLTRHNIGFMLIDALSQFWGQYSTSSFKSEHKALTQKLKLGENSILLAKPQTFMNLSGESVQALLKFYDIPIEKLIVAHDEVDIEFGQLRFQTNRGHAGNNGVRNIHERLGTNAYKRLKLGVGRPLNPHLSMADHVLQNFNPNEQAELPDLLKKACQAMEVYLSQGFQKAATEFN